MPARGTDSNRFRDPGLLASVFQQVRLAWRLFNDPRVPALLKAFLPVLAVLYMVSPVDLLPDLIPVLGQLDDIGILLAALTLFTRLAPTAVVVEHLDAMRGRRRATHQTPAWDETVIDADYRVHRER